MTKSEPPPASIAPGSPSRAVWIFRCVWIVLAVFLIFRAGLREGAGRGVIIDHLEFGRRLLEGLYLYTPYLDDGPLHPPYPPTFGLLTAPFSLLPLRAARFAWVILQIGALWALGAALLRFLRRMSDQPIAARTAHGLLAGTALLGARYVLRDTHGGGGNGINVALVVVACSLVRKRPGLAGLLLAISLATKPNLVLLVPVFWWLGQPSSTDGRGTAPDGATSHKATGTRALLYTATWVIVFVASTLVLLRFDLTSWQTWFRGVLAYGSNPDLFAPPAEGFPPFSWMNQSLRCAVTRFTGVVPSPHADIPGFFPGLGLSGSSVQWFVRGLSLLVILATAWNIVRSHSDRVRKGGYALGAVLIVTLLLSPISWKAHHVALVPAFFFLLATGFGPLRSPSARFSPRTHAMVWAAYIPSCVLGEELLGKSLKNTMQSLYLVTLWDLALLAMLVCLLSRQRQFVRDGSETPSLQVHD